ncbi:EcsC family protein [Rubripirellula amarantea]|uniref:EcsC protein family protein n=1 Tax=Rubripirellula amarantea TaxID=2527999 RepID=A0A5C5WSQ5_9BACT|nr:EcsC family protein [Rubripirellula amarantea]MDA8744334.1 EcsC family protein [Rubripirellula amarantea]TWT53806.1 EcsC protein family protein [Rubripirellula amarantea]
MKNELIVDTLPPEAVEELREAKRVLEHHGIADRLTELIGAPITASLKMLPDIAEKTVYSAIDKSLNVALDVAMRTLGDDRGGTDTKKDGSGPTSELGKPRLLTHKLLAGLSGAAGGAFGGATIAVELPVSTVLILRSVADIARSEGEDLSEIESRLACLQVFALDPGKKSDVDDDTEFGYFAVRAAMAVQIRDASQYLLKNGMADTTAPVLVKLVSQIGKRFGVVVSEKIAAQAIPVIGAIGGALINSYFIDHYQDLARAHFTIRRLERTYGESQVREAYGAMK